ncbi:MAG: winged helix-turn-helix domain-containing protein [Acutalibacter sp.]
MTGGELLGKLIILSFRDDEESLFSKAISALSSVADFSTATASADAPLLYGSLQIDPQRRLVWQAGQTVDLTPMEFDILLLLARRPGQVFSARQIYEAVATDSFDASWTGISSMVYKLRRKLGAGIIETVRGHGYKFVAPGTSPK